MEFDQEEIDELINLLESRKEELEDYIADGIYSEEDYRKELTVIKRILLKLYGARKKQ